MLPPPPSQSVSTTLQPARWDNKTADAKGKAREYISSSDSGSEDEDDRRTSFAITMGRKRHDDISRSDSRASSSKSTTSREYEGETSLWDQKQTSEGAKQRFKESRTAEKPHEFRVIKQATLAATRDSSSISTGSGDSAEASAGGARTGVSGKEMAKELQPIPSPPWAKSKPLPVARDANDKIHGAAPSQYPKAGSTSRSGSDHYSSAFTSGGLSVAQASPPRFGNAPAALRQQTNRGGETDPSSGSRLAWAAPQVARPQTDATSKPTLFKWVHSNPQGTAPTQLERSQANLHQHVVKGDLIRPREVNEQGESKVGSAQGEGSNEHYRQKQDLQRSNQIGSSEPPQAPSHFVSHPMSSSDPVTRLRSPSVETSHPPSPQTYHRRPPSPNSNIPVQHYSGSVGMRYQHPPPPPIMSTNGPNGHPYYRSHSYTHPQHRGSYPPPPPSPTRHRSYDYSSMGAPHLPPSPRAGQKRRYGTDDEAEEFGRKRNGTRGDIEMEHRWRIAMGSGPPPSASMSQDIDRRDQAARDQAERDQAVRLNAASQRTGHPRPRPGRLHWMPPEVAPQTSGPAQANQPSPPAGYSNHSITPPSNHQRPYGRGQYPGESNGPAYSYHPPPTHPPQPPPGYRAAYPPPPLHGYPPESHGPPHHASSYREGRPPYPPSYPPPPPAHYGHPGYPPPPPHYAPNGAPPPSGPGIPPPPHFVHGGQKQHIYEAEWRGRPSYETYPPPHSSRPRSRSPPRPYRSYPNIRPKDYGLPPPPPSRPHSSHHPPYHHHHPPYHQPHSPPQPPPHPPHHYAPHHEPPTSRPPLPLPYEHHEVFMNQQNGSRHRSRTERPRIEESRVPPDIKPPLPGSPMQTQQHPSPSPPPAVSTAVYPAAGASTSGYPPLPEIESGGMVTTPAPLAVNIGGKKNGSGTALTTTANLLSDGGEKPIPPPPTGEYEQHPLRQQTSYLPMNAVGGAQFVLKPPRQPKPRTIKPKAGSGGDKDKPKEPILKFKEMTGKEREGKRPRRRMKNRMQNEHMLMSGGNIFVPHVVELSPRMGDLEPLTFVSVDPVSASRPPPQPQAAHKDDYSTWNGSEPVDDAETTSSTNSASVEPPILPLLPAPQPSPPHTSILDPQFPNGSANMPSQPASFHRSPSPMAVPQPKRISSPGRQNLSPPPKEPALQTPGPFRTSSSPSPSPKFLHRYPYQLSYDSESEDELAEMMKDYDGVDPRPMFGQPIGVDEDPEATGSATNTFAAPARPSMTTKKYPCEVCGQIFTRSGDVKRHKETRHGEGSTGCICPFCDKVLTRQDALQRHWDKYCRKASRRNIHGYHARMDVSDDSMGDYEGAIDARPIFLRPAPNGLSRIEVEEDEAALGGSSGIDVKSFRYMVIAKGSRAEGYSNDISGKNTKGKRRVRDETKDVNGDIRMVDEGESEEDELESEDPMDRPSDDEDAQEEREARRMALGVDEDDEEIDQLDDSEDEKKRESGVKSEAEGESIRGEDQCQSEYEPESSGKGGKNYAREDQHMDVDPTQSSLMDSHGPSGFSAPPPSQPVEPVQEMPRLLPSIIQERPTLNYPLHSMVPLPNEGVQLPNGAKSRSSPTPPPPTDPYANSFRHPSTESQRRPTPQSDQGSNSRSASVSTSTSTQPTSTPTITFQHFTHRDPTRKGLKPRRNNYDAELDPSQTAAQGGQIRMRVLPQDTTMAPIKPALAIMHEHPHFGKKKGKRNDGQVPEFGFVPREYVYREKE